MRVYEIKRDAVVVNQNALEKDEALEYIIDLVCSVDGIDDCDEISKLIIDREARLSTGIGLEIAVPHCRVDSVHRIVVGAMLVPGGVDYNAVDGLPVKLIILLISPADDIRGHLACLSSISHAVSDESVRVNLLGSKTREELYENIIRYIKT